MGRKPNNTGTVSYHVGKKNPYVAQITTFGKRRGSAFATEQEAQAWIKRIAQQAADGAEDETVLAFLQRWLIIRSPHEPTDQVSQRDRAKAKLNKMGPMRATTHTLYAGTIERHIAPRLDPKLKMSRLQRKHVEALLMRCDLEGVGDRTRQIIRNVLSRAFNDAKKLKLLQDNPASDFSIPYDPKKRKALSPDEVQRLTKAVAGTLLEAAVPISATTTIRKGELLAVRWSNLDWDNAFLYIEDQVQRVEIPGKAPVSKQNKRGVGTGLVFTDVKTEKSRRGIPLGKRSIELLKRQFMLVNSWREQAGPNWKENDLIFPSYVGTPMEKTTVKRIYKRGLKEAGLPEDTIWHELRHTGVSAMSRKDVGAHAKVAMDRSGQALETVHMLYVHINDEEARDVAEKLDEVLLGDLRIEPEDGAQDSDVRRDHRIGKGKGVAHNRKKPGGENQKGNEG